MLALVVGSGTAVVGAALLASLLRPRSAITFVLATYLFAWAELLVVVFSLSAISSLDRRSLLAGLVVASAVAGVAWILAGRPTPPPLAAALRRGRDAASDPLVAILLVACGLALTYTLFITLTTAPNDGDPLVYEITRAAFWHQHHGVTNLHSAYDERIDVWPPVAEIGTLAVITLSENERYVGLVQWLAVWMLALGTYGVGRRIGLERPSALFGAALVPTLPVVLTQSWTAFTDMVFASFAVSAVYFGIGPLGLELVAFGAAVGLATGTKYLGPIFAPLFAVILGVAQPRRRWLPLAGAALAGAVLAGSWYARTQIESGDARGAQGAGQQQSHDVASVVTTFQHLSVEALDLSGASARGIWVYSVAALVVVAIALVLAVRRDRRARGLLVAAAALAAAPFVVREIARVWATSGVHIGSLLGRSDLVDQLRNWHASTAADGSVSWFGSLGALIAVAAVPLAVREVRRGRVARSAIALAAAPLVSIGLFSLVVTYQRYEGRYFTAAFALCAATFGGHALARRWLGTAIVGIAVVTALLTLVNAMGKPTGITILGEGASDRVWSMPRWQQQGILRPTPSERDEVATMRFVEKHVPSDARLGVALVENNYAQPYFGRHFQRELTIVDVGDILSRDIEWIVAAPVRTLVGCPASWRRERYGSYGWSVWRRVAPDSCATPMRLASG